MESSRRMLLRGLTGGACALGVGVGRGEIAPRPRTPSKTVTVSGAVALPARYSVLELGKMEGRPVDFHVPEGHRRSYLGTPLRTLLVRARPAEPDPLALRQSFVVAKGTDGYFALFTWAELFLGTHGDRVWVVYQRDGEPLGDDEGQIALISQGDARPGMRYVKWLSEVRIQRAAV